MTAWESFKKFYKVFRWVVLVGMVVVILLVMTKADPPAVKADPLAAERVNFKMYQAQRAVDSGSSHTLELDEPELNSLLAANLAFNDSQNAVSAAVAQAESGQPTIEEVKSNVRDVKIQLLGESVTAYVVFDMYGKELSLTLEGGLRVVDGYLRMEPTSGALGSMPIPQATLDNAVRRLFDSPENREKFRLPSHISDVRVENGQVKVYYNSDSN